MCCINSSFVLKMSIVVGLLAPWPDGGVSGPPDLRTSEVNQPSLSNSTSHLYACDPTLWKPIILQLYIRFYIKNLLRNTNSKQL